jgi:uncharacterized membrane-anchored protein
MTLPHTSRAVGLELARPTARDGHPVPPREERGAVRLGRRTKVLAPKLRRGEIAVIDHEDLDRLAAEDLVASGVRCVLNAARSSSGSFPNQGPLVLAEAGVHLVDCPGAPLIDLLEDGDALHVRGGEVRRDGRVVARGEVRDLAAVRAAEERGRERVGEALLAFADNTMRHIVEERDLLAGRLELPDLRTSFRDRPALVVVRGIDHQRDLRILRPYVRDERPVLVAVDGGADAMLGHGWVPDVIVGDMDSASDDALRCGAELVLHAYTDGRAPGRPRLEALGLEWTEVRAAATSEDVAMLLAAEKGAALIVTVGSHFNLLEFLERNRAGMSSTFLTRLRVGDILVDAKGVSRLYRPSAGLAPILFITLAALVTLVVVVLTSDKLQALASLLWLKLQLLLGLR